MYLQYALTEDNFFRAYESITALPCPLQVELVLSMVQISSMPLHIKIPMLLAFLKKCSMSNVPIIVAAIEKLLDELVNNSENMQLNSHIIYLSMLWNCNATRQLVHDWIVKNDIISKAEQVVFHESFPTSISDVPLFQFIALLLEADLMSNSCVNRLMENIFEFPSNTEPLKFVQLFAVYSAAPKINMSVVKQKLETQARENVILYLGATQLCDRSDLNEVVDNALLFSNTLVMFASHTLFDTICIHVLHHCAIYFHIPISNDFVPYLLQYAYQERPTQCKYKVAQLLQHWKLQDAVQLSQRTHLMHFLPMFHKHCNLSLFAKIADVRIE